MSSTHIGSLFTILLSFILSYSLVGQVELVADINPGEEDSGVYCDFSFTYNQDCAVTLSDVIIFIAENEDFGRELYTITNGSVELLNDLNEGVDSSNPNHMTVFQGQVYFLASDGSGYNIWRTDGTSNGTEVAFDLGVEDANEGDYTVFLINDDELFFEFQDNIYSYDGITLTQIEYESPISVRGSSGFNSKAWAPYLDGIAIFHNPNDTWDMLYIHDNQVEVLFNYPMDANSTTAYGVAAFDGGLLFNFDSSFNEEIEGRYLYEESTGTYTKQTGVFTRRVISVNSTSAVLMSLEEILLYDAQNPTGTQIIGNGITLVQGGDWNRTITNHYLAFQSEGGTFYDDNISLLNTDDGSVSTIYSGDDLTKMITLGNNIFFFGQSTNGFFNMSLYRYEIETETLEELIEINDPPFNDDLYPIGFQDGYIYYFGNLDEAFGVEIYRSELGVSTSTDEILPNSTLTLEQLSSNTYRLSSEMDDEIVVNIYNASGQRLQQESIDNNGVIVVEHTGFLYISASQSGVEKTFTKLINE